MRQTGTALEHSIETVEELDFPGQKVGRIPLNAVTEASILLEALKKHNPDMAEHARRVGDLAEEFGAALGLEKAATEKLRLGGMLHDIGKLFVSNEILDNTSSDLSEDDWKVIRQHTVRGKEILDQSDSLQDISDFALSHHENWDGTGYPNKLTQDEIPYLVRVVAIADVWDALRSDRSYQEARSIEDAKEIMRESAGKHLDPDLVEKFIALVDERDRLSEEHLVWKKERVCLMHAGCLH